MIGTKTIDRNKNDVEGLRRFMWDEICTYKVAHDEDQGDDKKNASKVEVGTLRVVLDARMEFHGTSCLLKYNACKARGGGDKKSTMQKSEAKASLQL
jgi:hypothetical protein